MKIYGLFSGLYSWLVTVRRVNRSRSPYVAKQNVHNSAETCSRSRWRDKASLDGQNMNSVRFRDHYVLDGIRHSRQQSNRKSGAFYHSTDRIHAHSTAKSSTVQKISPNATALPFLRFCTPSCYPDPTPTSGLKVGPWEIRSPAQLRAKRLASYTQKKKHYP